MDSPIARLHARRALLPDGWANNVSIDIGAAGMIEGVRPDTVRQPASEAVHTLLPGIPNVHSHAFQRALAGRTERAGTGEDSFWTWRESLYRFIDRIEPDDLSRIARMVYLEMLHAGYTAVAEFHYLHHDRRGERWPERAMLSRLMVEAARDTGIRITLLPVLYQFSGFGEQVPVAGQQRFVCGVDEFQALLESVLELVGDRVAAGLAFHSLRAVSPAAMDELLAYRRERNPQMPVHIHVAEQGREVEECVAWSGKRPVEWLLERGSVDSNWCLVHATHVTPLESDGLAATGAVAGLCPTTEASLGDGVFPLPHFLQQGGRIAIGSDSQVVVSPAEELRWLEYGQRLMLGQRNVSACTKQPHTGARLHQAVREGGGAALGQPIGLIKPGLAADLLEIDPDSPDLAGADGDEILDCLIFCGHHNAIRNVMVGGRWVIRNGRHAREELIRSEFIELQQRLRGRVH